MLWFDVEKRYLTTFTSPVETFEMLWFDVEKRYLTTNVFFCDVFIGCGLM